MTPAKTANCNRNARASFADPTGSEVRRPLCKGPARRVYRSEVTAWGDTPDNSTKGWQCGCDKCDHLFFISNKPLLPVRGVCSLVDKNDDQVLELI
jgi:hypothetical protein